MRRILLWLLLLTAAFSASAQTNDERESYRAKAADLATGSLTYRHSEALGTISGTHVFEVVFASVPSSANITITPYMRGGTSGTPVTSSTAGSQILSIAGTWDYFIVTATWTGSESAVAVNVTGTHNMALLRSGTGTYLASATGAPADGCAVWTGGNIGSTGATCGSGGPGGSTSPGGTATFAMQFRTAGGTFGGANFITTDSTGSYLTARAIQGIGSANGYAANNTVQGFQAAFAAGFPVVTRGYGYKGANDDPCPAGSAGLGQDYTSYYYSAWLGVKECYVGAGITRTFHTPLSLAGGSGDLAAETNYLNNTGYGRNYGNGPGSGNNLWRVSHGPVWHGYASAPGIFEMGSIYATKTSHGDFILHRKYQFYSGGNEDASGEAVEADHIEQDENPSYVAQISGSPAKGATVVLTTGGNGCGVDGGSCSGAGRILMRVASPTYAGAVTAVTGASITAPGTMTTAFAMTPSPAYGNTTDIPDSSDPNVGAATFADGSAAQITVSMLGGTNGTGSAFRAAGVACISAGSQWESTDYTSTAASAGKQVLSLLHHKGPLQGGAVKVYDGDCHYLSIPVNGGLYNRTVYIVYGITDAHTLEWGSQDAGARGSGPLGSVDNFRLPTTAIYNLNLSRAANGVVAFLPGGYGTSLFPYAGLTPTVSGCPDASFNGTATGPLVQAADGTSVSFATAAAAAGSCTASISFQGYNSIVITEGARVESNVNPAKPYTSGAIIDTRVDGTLTMDHNEAAWVSGETVEEALDANVRARGHFENAIKTSPQSGYGSAWFATRLQGYDLWANPQFNGNLPDYIGFGGWKSLPSLIRADGSIPMQYAVDSLYQPAGGFLHVKGNAGNLPGSAVTPSYFLWDHNGHGLAYSDFTKNLTLDNNIHLVLHDAAAQVITSQMFNSGSGGYMTAGGQFTGVSGGVSIMTGGAYYDGAEHYLPGMTSAMRLLATPGNVLVQASAVGTSPSGTPPGWVNTAIFTPTGFTIPGTITGGHYESTTTFTDANVTMRCAGCFVVVQGGDNAVTVSFTTGTYTQRGVLVNLHFVTPFTYPPAGGGLPAGDVGSDVAYNSSVAFSALSFHAMPSDFTISAITALEPNTSYAYTFNLR